MIKNYDIIVDFSKDKIIAPVMVFVQDDNLSTQLSFTFKDEIANDQNIKLTFKNNIGTIYEQLITVTDKKASYIVPNTLLSVSGYMSMTITYISGQVVKTNSIFINDIRVLAKLGVGQEPTPEEMSIINDIISQLNTKIAETNTATTFANEKGTYANEQGTFAQNQGNYAKDTGDTYIDILNNKVDKITGKGLSTNDYTTVDRNKVNNLPNDTVTILSNKADLENGKLVASQLPSYVDDVLNGYYRDNKFYEEETYTTEIIGETGKIYIDLDTNITYRWSGIDFVEVSSSLALGETSSTAFRGDLGKVAYEHSQATGNPHNLTASDLGALTTVTTDNSLTGTGTVANPLMLNKEELASFEEYQSRLSAGTLLNGKFYYWGE